jgi:hypothetical protein
MGLNIEGDAGAFSPQPLRPRSQRLRKRNPRAEWCQAYVAWRLRASHPVLLRGRMSPRFHTLPGPKSRSILPIQLMQTLKKAFTRLHLFDCLRRPLIRICQAQLSVTGLRPSTWYAFPPSWNKPPKRVLLDLCSPLPIALVVPRRMSEMDPFHISPQGQPCHLGSRTSIRYASGLEDYQLAS